MANSFPSNIMIQARTTLSGWQQINPPLPAIGTLTPTDLIDDMAEVQQIINQIIALEAQLTNLRNQRDERYGSLWDKVKRARAGIKGIYGDDASEYEMVGGTRRSERRRPLRTKTNNQPPE